MNSDVELTLAYIEQVPRAAAQVLQGLRTEVSSAYLESVPARLSMPVLQSMAPWHAARVIELMPATRAAMILRHLTFNDAATLARLVGVELRARIFDELPGRYARRLANALRYPVHQVGAWIDPDVPVASLETTVEEAIRTMRAAETASHVFVESAEKRFVGAVALRELLRRGSGLQLSQIRLLEIEPVPSRASLASLKFDERWDQLLHLPVIGRRGNLLGGLSRKAMRQGLRDEHAAHEVPKPTIARELAMSLAVTCAGLLRLIAGAPVSLSSVADGAETNER